MRVSIIYKGPVQFLTQPSAEAAPDATDQVSPTTATKETVECGSTVLGAVSHQDDVKGQGH